MRRSISAALALIVSLGSMVLPAQASSTAMTLTQRFSFNQVDFSAPQGSPLEVPGGSSVTLVIDFACNTISSVSCVDPEASVTLPAGVTIGLISYSTSFISSMGTIGNVRNFDFNTLAPGTTGQITIPMTVQEWVHLDGAGLEVRASGSTESGASNPVSANTVYLEVRSATTNRALAALNAGGALDSSAQYSVSACLDRVDGSGGLGVQAGARLITTLPDGAVFVRSGDPSAVYDAANRTVTVTTTSPKNDAFCGGYTIDVSYPTGGTNINGASKQISFEWVGRKLGEATDSLLATASHTHTLTAPALGGGVGKSVNGTRSVGSAISAATGDPISYLLSLSNNNTRDWDSATVTDTIPDAVKVVSLGITNRGRGPATLAIKTDSGADGIKGNSDDNDLISIATLPAPAAGQATSTLNLSSLYSSNVGALGRPLGPDELLTFVSLGMVNVPPGTAGLVINMGALVLGTYSDNALVVLGDVITNRVDLGISAGDQTLNQSATANLLVDSPVPQITVRNAPLVGNLGPGIRTGSTVLSGLTSGYKLPNPRFVAILPKFVSLTSWSSTDNSLPTASLLETRNFDGQGRTRLLFSWPNGTELAQNADWMVTLNLNFGFGSFGSLRVGGYVSSASIPSNCSEPWFQLGADVADFDQDGNLSENLCAWGADFTLATDASTGLTSFVKGSWDSEFAIAPGVGFTTPNSSDEVRAELLNTGTVNMSDVIVVSKLPRPGDSSTISTSNRNPVGGTFPVKLRTKPIVPTGLTNGQNNTVIPVVTYYSTQSAPCLIELNFSAAGCEAAAWTDWDLTPPTVIDEVTFLKFDFGQAVLTPGDVWEIAMGISTPASGSSETDFAVVNPTTNSADDEKAYISFASRTSRVDLNSRLGASESTSVVLQMPSVYGPPVAPIALPKSTSGTQGNAVNYTITPPIDGTVHFWNGTTAVTNLVIAGEGSYTIIPETGVVTFTPLANFTGQTTAVAYQIKNIHNLTANSTLAINMAPAPPTTPGPSAPLPSVVAPPVPEVPLVPTPLPPSVPVTPSQGVSTVNNISVPVPVSANPRTNIVSVLQPEWSLSLGSLTTRGSTAKLDPSGRVIATNGLQLQSSGTGFAPNSTVRLFLIGNPEPIATLETDALGNFTVNVPVPAGLSAGISHFQVAGVTPENSLRTTSLEISVKKLRLVTRVLFSGDSAVLTESAKRVLASLARRLGGVYGSIRVTSTGFVNRTSDTSYDLRLSRQRARNASEYLKSLGIDASFTVRVFGIAPEKGKPARRAELTATVN